MNTPNIFHHAPSELSQDAVLAYMLEWADVRHKGNKMHELGQSFAKRLLGKDGASAVSPIKTVCVHTQYSVGGQRNADVVAIINGEFALLIEDKTDTTEHSDQLAVYLKALQEKYKVFPVYLKTGYGFTDEREFVIGQKYRIFDLGDLVRFLDDHKNIDDDVFAQYRAHCTEISTEREKMINEACDGKLPPAGSTENLAWNYDYAQWEFMLKLKEKLESAGNNGWMKLRAGLPKAHHLPKNLQKFTSGGGHRVWIDEKNETFIQRGQSRGAPWTQYWFTKTLFWRIDPGYPLRLRFGIWDNETSKHDPWPKYQEVFKQCLGIEGRPLQAGDAGTKASANERTVGAIAPIDVNTFLEHIAKVQNRFVKEIQGKWDK